MIHPATELRFVSSEIGYGVFATRPIPRGTIVYAKDMLEIEVTPAAFQALEPRYREIVEKYSYIDERGVLILSWDHGKYVNHRCDCNTISTGYGFEIAIRDIAPDEEITDEYGLFNIPVEIEIACHCPNCRGRLRPSDIDQYYPLWDSWVVGALDNVRNVDQPLWPFVDPRTQDELLAYLDGREPYSSVLSLKNTGVEEAAPAPANPRVRLACERLAVVGK